MLYQNWQILGVPGDSSQFWQNLWPEKTFLRTSASCGELFRTCFQHLQHLRVITEWSSRYCPPILSRTRWDNVMEENYNFGRGDLDSSPSSPLHCSTSTLRRTPPPPLPQKCWTSRHILSPHQISGSVRGRITDRRGISSRISSGWIPAGAPAPTAGLVLPPSQLWLYGCIVRAQPHPHPPIHTRDLSWSTVLAVLVLST